MSWFRVLFRNRCVCIVRRKKVTINRQMKGKISTIGCNLRQPRFQIYGNHSLLYCFGRVIKFFNLVLYLLPSPPHPIYTHPIFGKSSISCSSFLANFFLALNESMSFLYPAFEVAFLLLKWALFLCF